MPFIRREDIDPKIRGPHENRHKAALKAALLNPGLTAAQRTHLREQLKMVGQPKTYDAETPPKPGAISFKK